MQPNPPKKHCSSSTSKPPSKSESGIRRYNKKWEETFPCCRWVESGVPKEHFIQILSMKKANAESNYSALVEYCREKEHSVGKAYTFSGDKTGVQRWLKELSPCIVCSLSLSCPSTGFCASY